MPSSYPMRLKAKFPILSERNQALKAPAITWALRLKTKAASSKQGNPVPHLSCPSGQCILSQPIAMRRRRSTKRMLAPNCFTSALRSSSPCCPHGLHWTVITRSLEISERQQAGHISIFSSTKFFKTFSIELNLLDESIEQQLSRDAHCCPPDSAR
ncbi:hypothetical protein ACOJBO_03385 [Rhizobium beringeri]